MREYGKIKTSFWTSPKVRGLSEHARLLLLYLYACPHGNAIGCFQLPMGYICEDMDWAPKRASELVSELVSKGFIERDDAVKLVRIKSWWQHNTVENRNVARGVVKVVNALPPCRLVANAVADLKAKAVGNEFLTAVITEFPTLVPNEEGIPEPEPEPEPEHSAPTRVVVDDAFEDFWKAYPHRGEHSDPKKPAREKFAKAIRDGADPETIIRGAQGYATAMRGKDAQIVAQAQTWLHQARWEQYAASAESVVAVVNVALYAEWVPRWRKGEKWPSFLGPLPGEPSCRCPPHLLAEPKDDAA